MLASNDQTDQLERDLRHAILNGVLTPSSKLMSVRALADQYKLSYGRTLRTLKRLELQGLLISKHGGGTYVADQIPTPAQVALPVGATETCAIIAVPPNYWAHPDRSWYVQFLHGFEAVMNEKNSSMKVMSADAYFNRSEPILPNVRTQIVLAPMNPEQMADVKSRVHEQLTIVLAAHDPKSADWALVMDIDGACGIRQALTEITGRGHHRIGYISWSLETTPREQHWWLEMRAKAFAEYAAAKSLSYVAIQVPFPRAEEEVERAIRSGLMALPRPTALVCANDILAGHALKVCAKEGLKVPEDISLVGFDDEPWTVAEGVSTVHRPYIELGRMAAELAWQRQRHGMPRCRGALTISPKLVVRGSIKTL